MGCGFRTAKGALRSFGALVSRGWREFISAHVPRLPATSFAVACVLVEEEARLAIGRTLGRCRCYRCCCRLLLLLQDVRVHWSRGGRRMSCAGGRRDDTRPRGVSAILVGMIGGVHPRDGESGASERPCEVKSTLYTAYERERERVAIEGGTQIGRGDFRGNVHGDSRTKVRACVRELDP